MGDTTNLQAAQNYAKLQRHAPISKKEEGRPKVKVTIELESGETWSGMAENIVVDQNFPLPYPMWDDCTFFVVPKEDDHQWDMKIYGLRPFIIGVKERLTNAEILAIVEERLREEHEETDTP